MLHIRAVILCGVPLAALMTILTASEATSESRRSDELAHLRALVTRGAGFTQKFRVVADYGQYPDANAFYDTQPEMAIFETECFDRKLRTYEFISAWVRWPDESRYEHRLPLHVGPRERTHGVEMVLRDRIVTASDLRGDNLRISTRTSIISDEQSTVDSWQSLLVRRGFRLFPLVLHRGVELLDAARDRTVSELPNAAGTRVASESLGIILDVSPDGRRLIAAHLRFPEPMGWRRMECCYEGVDPSSPWPAVFIEYASSDPSQPLKSGRMGAAAVYDEPPRFVDDLDPTLFDPSSMIANHAKHKGVREVNRVPEKSRAEPLSVPTAPATFPPPGPTPWSQPAGWQANHWLLLAGGVVTLSGVGLWLRRRFADR